MLTDQRRSLAALTDNAQADSKQPGEVKREPVDSEHPLTGSTQSSDGEETRSITIRVVDPDGQPIGGAKVFRNHVYKREGETRPKIENKFYWTNSKGEAAVALSGQSVDLRIWAAKANFIPLHAMWAKQFQSDGDQSQRSSHFIWNPVLRLAASSRTNEASQLRASRSRFETRRLDMSR